MSHERSVFCYVACVCVGDLPSNNGSTFILYFRRQERGNGNIIRSAINYCVCVKCDVSCTFSFLHRGHAGEGERGGFQEVEPNKPPYKGDGVCIKKNGKYRRFKAVNGADICLQDGELVPCGWGSCLMQRIGCGGWEVPSIQGKKAWRCGENKGK